MKREAARRLVIRLRGRERTVAYRPIVAYWTFRNRWCTIWAESVPGWVTDWWISNWGPLSKSDSETMWVPNEIPGSSLWDNAFSKISARRTTSTRPGRGRIRSSAVPKFFYVADSYSLLLFETRATERLLESKIKARFRIFDPRSQAPSVQNIRGNGRNIVWVMSAWSGPNVRYVLWRGADARAGKVERKKLKFNLGPGPNEMVSGPKFTRLWNYNDRTVIGARSPSLFHISDMLLAFSASRSKIIAKVGTFWSPVKIVRGVSDLSVT